MAFAALELAYVAQINRVLKATISFMTAIAVEAVEVAQINGMAERAVLNRYRIAAVCLVKSRMADVAIASYDFARLAYVLAVVTAEAALPVIVPDVIRVCAPIDFHLREEVCLKNSLHFYNGRVNRIAPC